MSNAHAPPQTYHFSSEPLIRSCPLPESMTSHKGNSNNSLTVRADKIEPLSSYVKRHKNHIEYQVIEQLIDSIGRQLQYLERMNMGIASFNMDDIMVFHTDTDTATNATATNATATDDTATAIHFAFTNEDKIHDINDDHHLVITAPYPKEYTAAATAATKNKGFHSPEFKEFIKAKTVPFNIHFKSGYYSFGLLCLYCYVSRAIAAIAATAATATATDTEKDLNDILAPIINTKIYWFLKQVLQENPTSRRYICV
jgi:hypothetical protein